MDIDNEIENLTTTNSYLHARLDETEKRIYELAEHFRIVATFSHQTEESANAWRQAANQIEKIVAEIEI